MDELIQNETGFEPADEFVVRNLEALKAISDPTRVRLLEAFFKEARTVKQVATEVGIPATKLYYHVNVLEELGLLRVVATRVVSGIIEKSYRTAAKRIHGDPKLFTLDAEEREQLPDALLAAVLDTTRNDLKQEIQARRLDLTSEGLQTQGVLLGRSLHRLTQAQARLFAERLTSLMNEFAEGEESEAADSQVFSLTLALFPLARAAEEDE